MEGGHLFAAVGECTVHNDFVYFQEPCGLPCHPRKDGFDTKSKVFKMGKALSDCCLRFASACFVCGCGTES